MRTFFLLAILFVGGFVNAQTELTSSKIIQLKAKVDQMASKYKDSINSRLGDTKSSIGTDFKTDVYRVDKLADLKVGVDYSTAGMTAAIVSLNNDYDALLNKYYTILMKRLTPEDQEKLKIAQRNWLNFRDSEIQVITTVSKGEYSGGGTIQSNIMAGRISDLTKQRLNEIMDHLNQFMD